MGEENNEIVFMFISSATFVVVLTILLVLFLVLNQKRIVSQEHRLQKLENERQRLLLKATIEGQERERRRLAKDLHDGLGSLLSGLSMNLKFQKNKEDSSSQQGKFLEEACQLLDVSINQVREVSHNLMPATLEQFGLLAAIKEYIVLYTKNGVLEVDFRTLQLPTTIEKEIELGMFRIFQELLQNTLKHANATKIKALLATQGAILSLKYHDDGCGLNETVLKKGIGLKNIESRVSTLRGTFQIVEKNKKGFGAVILLPLPVLKKTK